MTTRQKLPFHPTLALACAIGVLLSLARWASAQECDGTCNGLGCPSGQDEYMGSTACRGGVLYQCWLTHALVKAACDDLEAGSCAGGFECNDEVEEREGDPNGCNPTPGCDRLLNCDGPNTANCACENCGGALEECGNGLDDDHDGIVDNPLQCGGPDPDPCAEISAQTSFAFGNMRLEDQVDVRLASPGPVSLELVRYYASGMSTRFRKNKRIADMKGAEAGHGPR